MLTGFVMEAGDDRGLRTLLLGRKEIDFMQQAALEVCKKFSEPCARVHRRSRGSRLSQGK